MLPRHVRRVPTPVLKGTPIQDVAILLGHSSTESHGEALRAVDQGEAGRLEKGVRGDLGGAGSEVLRYRKRTRDGRRDVRSAGETRTTERSAGRIETKSSGSSPYFFRSGLAFLRSSLVFACAFGALGGGDLASGPRGGQSKENTRCTPGSVLPPSLLRAFHR